MRDKEGIHKTEKELVHYEYTAIMKCVHLTT